MITSLTSFRFFTAFVVFLFHCRIHLGWATGVPFIDEFLWNGASFMTGFFVLSGFIMAHVYGPSDFTKRENIWVYYLKRFAKIYPTYLAATVVYFLFFHDYSLQQLSRVAVNDLFLVQGFFSSMFGVGINGGTWSLTVEMFLYFLFPFLILLSGKSEKILIFALVLSVIVSFNVTLEDSDYIYANPVFRISDFMFGMGFYFAKEKFKTLRFASGIHIAIVVLLIFFCVGLSGGPQYMRGQFLVAPLFGLWIVMTYYSSATIYNHRVFEYLGLVSYSFYLWQFAAIELGKFWVKRAPEAPLHFIVLVLFVFNVLLASLSYHLIEEKLRRLILERFSKKVASLAHG